MNVAYYRKAAAAGLAAFLGALYVALSDNHVTAREWVGIGQATLAATVVVHATPNKTRPKPGPGRD